MNDFVNMRQVGLGLRLRQHRERSAMTTRSVARALDISPSSVNRTELGQRQPSRDELGALCALYGVTGEQKILLMESATKIRESAWFEMTSKVSGQMAAMTAIEREASRIVNIEIALVPGLTQTAEYARLIMGLSESDHALEERVRTRLARQAVLSQPNAPEIGLFVDETALRRTLGNAGVMREQLRHLLVVGRRENVTLRVIPLSAPVHPALDGPFVLYELPDGSTHVYVESRYFGVFLAEPADVSHFEDDLRKLDDHALDPESSASLIKNLAEEHEHE